MGRELKLGEGRKVTERSIIPSIMAYKKTSEGARSNKIRFVLVEADISDGNLSELTHAITNALKPTIVPVRTPLRQTTPAVLPSSGNGVNGAEEDEVELVTDLESEEENRDAEEPGPQKVPRVRPKLPLPKYLADLDLSGGGTPFKQFAEDKAPKSQMKRYLLCALWLKEYGGSPTINTDKVYSLFKTAGWPVGIKDWDATFRQAVKRDLLHRKGPGEYTITPLGEDRLQKAEE